MGNPIHRAAVAPFAAPSERLCPPAGAAADRPGEPASAPAAAPSAKPAKPDWLGEALSCQRGRYDRR